MQRIDRIKSMEEKFDKALKAVDELDTALENFDFVQKNSKARRPTMPSFYY